jgi:hypothetical protein
MCISNCIPKEVLGLWLYQQFKRRGDIERKRSGNNFMITA